MKPTLKKSDQHGEVFEHPAFGTITMTSRSTSGNGVSLFGSDIGHNQSISIEIQQADLTRHLGQDWIHGTKKVCRFSMSHAQFAQFITSTGNGNGTPITFDLYRTGDITHPPAIEKIETKHQTHQREIKESASRAVDKIRDEVSKLEALLSGPSIGKKQLAEIVHTLKCTVDNVPSNMEFTVKQAEEALEKATSDAKIEIESFIAMKAQKLGFENLTELLKLEDKNEHN